MWLCSVCAGHDRNAAPIRERTSTLVIATHVGYDLDLARDGLDSSHVVARSGERV